MSLRIPAILLILGIAVPPDPIEAPPRSQDHTPAIGAFYVVSFPQFSGDRLFREVQVERTAPHQLAAPAPIAPVPLPVAVRTLTGDIIELPNEYRLYIGAIDAGGVARLFEIDLIRRASRELAPPPILGRPYAVRALAASDGRKIYVQWLGAGPTHETHIYDGGLLSWLGSTSSFAAHPRALDFEHRAPYLWTFDFQDRLTLVDTHEDRPARDFQVPGVSTADLRTITDAWRDLILVHSDRGRFRVIDVASGESGPPLDVPAPVRADARLVLDGRFLALIEARHLGFDRRRGLDVYGATGQGAVWDLRSGHRAAEFSLGLPQDFPLRALGTEPSPSRPGRLWVYGAGDRQELDLAATSCDGRSPPGGGVRARLEVRRTPKDGGDDYAYTLRLDPQSEAPAWALAVAAGHRDGHAGAPSGWGIDRVGGGRWIRWTNGLGPPEESVQPGGALGGFEIRAEPGAAPAIVDYRVQAETGLPRGCESDDRFLENSVAGRTIGLERSDMAADAPGRAERLVRLVDESCRLEWLPEDACDELRARAAGIARVARPVAALDTFMARLEALSQNGAVVDMLAYAAAAVREALQRSSR